jgi:hypothetical protein
MIFTEKVGKINTRIAEQQVIFFYSFQVKRGGISVRIMIQVYIAIEHTGQYTYKEKGKDDLFIYPCIADKFYFAQQPAKESEINKKKQVAQR